jgi:hypothetical protein
MPKGGIARRAGGGAPAGHRCDVNEKELKETRQTNPHYANRFHNAAPGDPIAPPARVIIPHIPASLRPMRGKIVATRGEHFGSI